MITAAQRDVTEEADAVRTKTPLLVIFSDDWGRHPSSSQHLVRELLPRYEVVWVNTIGMCPPTLSRHTARRVAGKLREWCRPRSRGRDVSPTRKCVAGPRVAAPKMWPWFRTGFDRRLNRELLGRQLAPMLADAGRPVVAVTSIPVTADLIGTLPIDRWVYYCVDDFSAWPGLDRRVMADMEAVQVGRVDAVAAVSEVLRERLTRVRDDVAFLPHGVDAAHWRTSPGGPKPPAEQVATFWGLIDRRLDVDWLRTLSERFRGTIRLVGPTNDPPPELDAIPRVELMPAVPYADLPDRVAADSDVLVMPYVDAAVTRAMQPLKLLEYLATGKPVVNRALPAVAEWADACDACTHAAEFAETVRLRAERGIPDGQIAARRRLDGHSWAERARHFETLLDIS